MHFSVKVLISKRLARQWKPRPESKQIRHSGKPWFQSWTKQLPLFRVALVAVLAPHRKRKLKWRKKRNLRLTHSSLVYSSSVQIPFEHWLPVWFGGCECRRKGKERFRQGSAKVFWLHILNSKLNTASWTRCEAYSNGWESTFCCHQFDFFWDPAAGGSYNLNWAKKLYKTSETHLFPTWSISCQATVEELGVIHTKLDQIHREPSAQAAHWPIWSPSEFAYLPCVF